MMNGIVFIKFHQYFAHEKNQISNIFHHETMGGVIEWVSVSVFCQSNWWFLSGNLDATSHPKVKDCPVWFIIDHGNDDHGGWNGGCWGDQ